MAKRDSFPLIGITLATPAFLIASPSQASIASVASFHRPTATISASSTAAQARLKSELLGLGRGEKLRIAGDRIRLAAAEHTNRSNLCQGTTAHSSKAGGSHPLSMVAPSMACPSVRCGSRGTINTVPTHTPATAMCHVGNTTTIACGSDIRLKRNVTMLERLESGLGLYRFRYLWSPELYVGVMAQEVLAAFPDSVVRGPNGYLYVCYERLGLRMRTWAEWLASNADNHNSQRDAGFV